MRFQEALNILGLAGEVTQEEAKLAYRQACHKYHPDKNPAGLEMMQIVNGAWDVLRDADWTRGVRVEPSQNEGLGDVLNDALNALNGLPGLVIEICGSWIWVTGQTKPVKDVLKSAGYRWAHKKQAWYFRPPEFKSRSRGKYSMEEIRAVYGSQSYQTEEREKVEAA